MELLQKYYSI